MEWIRGNLVRIVSVALIVVAIAWFARGRIGGAGPVAPVLPEQLDALDPSVVALVERAAEAAGSDRRNADRWVELGMVYEANGLFRYAVAAYEQAIALRDDHAPSWYRLGASHERVGDLDRAVAAMRRAAALDDALVDVQWQLGAWLLDTGDLDEAEPHLRRAATLAPADARPLFGLARLALARRDADEAVKIIEMHGLLHGANAAYAYRLLGQAHRLRGETESAQIALARGGSGAPTFGTVRVEELMPYRTGVVAARQDIQRFLNQGRREEARTRLEQLRQLDPTDTGTLVMLARLDLQERRGDQAIAHLETALGIAPNDFEVNVNIANVLRARGGPGDLERALEQIDRAIAARPLDARARRVKGRLLARVGRGAEAIDMLRAAYRRDSRDIGLLALAGAIEVQVGRWQDAIETLNAVLVARPGDPHALLGLARAHVELGQTAEAARALDGIAPDAPVNRQMLDALRQRVEAESG